MEMIFNDFAGCSDVIYIPKRQNKRTVAGPRNITEYGNSMLLHEMMKEIKPLLKEGFSDHWEEICVLLRSVFDKPFFKRLQSVF